MRDATGRDAVTIAGFLHTVDDKRIEATSHLIIDEASMLDVPGFYAILRRLRGRANIVLVGDDFQLPPIGSGKILHLLSGRTGVPVTVLDRVWRQEEGNSIRPVATAVRSGHMPRLPNFSGMGDGVSIFNASHSIPEAVCELFEHLGGAEDASDVRVIAPRRTTGLASAHSINLEIHRAFFSYGEPVIGATGDTGFNLGDRFVCDKNHWDIDLMNGSLGRILRHPSVDEVEAAERVRDEGRAPIGPPIAIVEIDGAERLISENHLLDCSWGYALTCHRAQGSDFSRVIVVLDDRVDQSWLYTAITRARRQVVVIGTEAQVERILGKPPRVNERCVGLETLLSRRLRSTTGVHE
jgi:exodeoxyribonuclease V alpha subunit